MPTRREELLVRPIEEQEFQREPLRVSGGRGTREEHLHGILVDMKPLFQRLTMSKEFLEALEEGIKVLTRLCETAAGTHLDTERNLGLFAPELRYDANIQALDQDFRHILERFSSNKSLDPTVNAFNEIRQEMNRDYQLKDFMLDWQSFASRCIKDPEYLEHEEYTNRGMYLLNKTDELAEREYRNMFNEAYNSVYDLIEGWQNDPLTGELGQVLKRIVLQDLMGGKNVQGGIFAFDALQPDLIQDFRNYFIPQFLKGLYEIPIPRIESHSDGTLLVLEDLVIPSESFVPVDFELTNSSRLRMNPKRRLLGRSMGTKLERTIEKETGWHNSLVIRMYCFLISLGF